MDGAHVHTHGVTAAGAARGRLTAVLGLTVTIMVAEVVGGVVAHSLVLLTDAAHMLADAVGAGLTLLAVALAARPPTSGRTFGMQRAEILAALLNAALLTALGGVLVAEAVHRLVTPGHSRPGVMAVLGVVALAGNATSLSLLHRGQQVSMNVRGLYLEAFADLLGAVAVLVSALVIATAHFQRIDAIASLFIALLILPRALRLLRDASDVLLEATPKQVDLDDVRAHLLETSGVVGVHDLHAWTITSGSHVLSAHVVVADALWRDGSAGAVLDRLGDCLRGHFDVEHSTFQIEAEGHLDHEGVLHR